MQNQPLYATEVSALPFTPFHFGPALLLGLALSTAFDLPTLLLASVIPDIEPFTVLQFGFHTYPLHGFFHSYLGSSILAALLCLIVYPLRGFFAKIMAFFRLSQKQTFKKIIFTSFAGVYSHVFMDSFLYAEMKPFYPLPDNPFINLLSNFDSFRVVYDFCMLAGVLGLFLYVYRVRKGVAVLE